MASEILCTEMGRATPRSNPIPNPIQPPPGPLGNCQPGGIYLELLPQSNNENTMSPHFRFLGRQMREFTAMNGSTLRLWSARMLRLPWPWSPSKLFTDRLGSSGYADIRMSPFCERIMLARLSRRVGRTVCHLVVA